jgi:hypothetical protein
MQQRVCWGQSTELESHWRIVLVENLNFFILLNINPKNRVTNTCCAQPKYRHYTPKNGNNDTPAQFGLKEKDKELKHSPAFRLVTPTPGVESEIFCQSSQPFQIQRL